MLKINIQWLLCTVIKFHAVKNEPEKDLIVNSCAVLCARLVGELWSRMTITRPDIGLIDSLLTAKCSDLSLLIDYIMYFKDVIQYSRTSRYWHLSNMDTSMLWTVSNVPTKFSYIFFWKKPSIIWTLSNTDNGH